MFEALSRISGTFAPVFVANSVWKRKVRRSLRKNEGTHVEDTTNLVKIRFPSSDRIFIVCIEGSEERIPFSTLDDTPLDFGHGAAIEILVGELFRVWVANLTYVVSCSIALKIGEPG